MVSMHGHPTVKIYVEGGGNGNHVLNSECRKAFKKFFEKAGLSKRLPRVIPCGRRNGAYDDFCTALKCVDRTGDRVFLLVDSEDAVQTAFMENPWGHLLERDGWEVPSGASSEQVHLMVECMENWFLADKEALRTFFGQGFRANSLPNNPNIEKVTKPDVLDCLGKASRETQKGQYGKGAHSFKILEIIDARKVLDVSPSAQRLINELKKVL
ncbi:DUF4276 family protein [Desulfosporosinus sp.]|uniref:DUF4276 family protein n=1 Tax=Desulfosporosinus sp. TaxID=157907 RepID=UPI00262858C4|nr:DUF4276 family protein [Desulfosporosinus sp.]